MNPTMLDRFHDALSGIPAPGGGCHPALLSVANYGVMAGLDPQQIQDDILQSIPQGRRRVPEREITDAVNKALSDHQRGQFIPRPRPKPIIKDGKTALHKIMGQGKISDDADLWESSPIRLYDSPGSDPALLLETLFNPDDLVWIGDRIQPGILDNTIRTASAWITYFQNGGKTAPHIIINPLTGDPAPTKSGDSISLRGDGNVKFFRYCIVEFDDLSRENQIRFWSAVKLPIVALIDTGGKSIHAWLDIQQLSEIQTSVQWESEIKTRLYDRILKPLGVDGACSNPARLSRLPGHCRDGKYQRLLWLSKEGTPC